MLFKLFAIIPSMSKAMPSDSMKQKAREELKKVLQERFNEEVVSELFDSDQSRTNASRGSGPNTVTEEVEIPVSGFTESDSPHTSTVERERVEPGRDPRLNDDMSAAEISRASREGLTVEEELQIQGGRRTNSKDANPEEVPVGGWDHGGNDE